MSQDTAVTNFHAPLQAQVADPVDTTRVTPFHVVSECKFLMLFFVTFGLYSFYWFWRHWKLHKIDKKLKILPVMRSILQIFFAHSLNREIDHLLQRKQRRFAWSPNGLAAAFVASSIIANICDRLSWREIGSPYTDIVSLVSLLPVGY